MASGIVRKAMVYLGLTDDEYEDYDAYEDAERRPRPGAMPSRPSSGRVGIGRCAR